MNPCPPDTIVNQLRTPCYAVIEDAVERNCRLLASVQERTGCRILLAMKAFALPKVFPLIRRHLHGVCASGPIEARMGREDFGREVHTYAPAYSDEQFETVLKYADHILFNSLAQWNKFKPHQSRPARQPRP
jgi:carboxynorspermidine decarboxylase